MGEGEAKPSTMAGSLDLSQRIQQRWFADSIRHGWQIDPELKRKAFQAVRVCLDLELAKARPNHRVVRNLTTIIQKEERLALEDLQHQERLDGIKLAAANRVEPAVNVTVNSPGPAQVQVESKPPIDYDGFRKQFVAEGDK
jgi:hypothetical protein